MGIKDFSLLFTVCFVWGLNIVITRWVVFDAAVPPIFFAAIRFLGVAVLLIPFLRPIPEDIKTLFLISFFIGAGHFALLFVGLANAEASAASVVSQLAVPFSTLMSMAFLGETIGWRRGIGIMLAFAGVLLIAVDPASFTVSFGLLYIAGAAFIGSVGGILMKRMKPVSAMQMQVWIALFSFAPLFVVSAFLEQGQWTTYVAGGWLVWVATAFAVVGVSIFGHGAFYHLIKKYDISLLSPLTLMTPIWGVVLSIVLLNDAITPQLILGAVVSLGGVLVIALRPNRTMPEASMGEKIGSGGS
ncbi:membrane protein [Litorimonas cladophorae]|uniref:Membrane protein n=1 Tax=Litorimonas cladophorae TaxID=1220491 RepID=A0A918KIV3_9PROT|nr:DMT family transporter [Litorimonas cladophorae]GGX62817.1 membrane protein [Litorimonas cladophorae]